MTIDDALKIALQHHQAGQMLEAERIYRHILSQNPNHDHALHLLGLVARRSGHLSDAEQLIRRAVELQPTAAHYLGNLGLVLADQQRLEEAAGVLQRAIEISPVFAQAHNNLGVVLRDLMRFEDSVRAFETAVRLHPAFAQAHSNLSSSLLKLGRQSEALESARRAVQISPELNDARYNLGTALLEMGRLEEAETELGRVVAINPNHAVAQNNLGNAQKGLNRLHEARAAYTSAIAAQPEYAEAHWNLAVTALLSGDFETGWLEHEWRFTCDTLDRPALLPQPQWRGETLQGRTILLHAEQGLGDSIQFVRYAPLVAARGGKVLLQVQPGLLKLFRSLPGIANLFALHDKLPEFQLQCPLMSLPLALNTRLETIPCNIPYLSATAESQSTWKEKLCDDSRFKVGLVWAGSPGHKHDRQRSMKLAELQPLAGLQGIRFISLQKGSGTDQLQGLKAEWDISDFTDEQVDFTDTAGLISQLDLVISVDTSVAHLAGAMGKPVWVLLAFAPDWRWMLNRADSPWYPNTRLFRQHSAGQWKNVVQEVYRALQAESATPRR